MTNNTAVEFKNVFEKYDLEIKTEEKTFRETFEALKDISFSVRRGESLAVIGPNGAGKSTLLRLVAGLLRPEKGEVKVSGRVASLLDLGAGFHPELTGRDNLLLNASLYNFSREEINAKLQKILNFAEIGRFIDAPVRCYSQGMYVRLAFSLAIHVDPEILLIDDCLAVGDDQFRIKSFDKVLEFRARGKTILFVTHDFGAAKQLCKRGIYLREGTLITDGDIQAVVDCYTRPLDVDKARYKFLSDKISEEETHRQREEAQRRNIEEEKLRKDLHERLKKEEEDWRCRQIEVREAKETEWNRAEAERQKAESEAWNKKEAERREKEKTSWDQLEEERRHIESKAWNKKEAERREKEQLAWNQLEEKRRHVESESWNREEAARREKELLEWKNLEEARRHFESEAWNTKEAERQRAETDEWSKKETERREKERWEWDQLEENRRHVESEAWNKKEAERRKKEMMEWQLQEEARQKGESEAWNKKEKNRREEEVITWDEQEKRRREESIVARENAEEAFRQKEIAEWERWRAEETKRRQQEQESWDSQEEARRREEKKQWEQKENERRQKLIEEWSQQEESRRKAESEAWAKEENERRKKLTEEWSQQEESRRKAESEEWNGLEEQRRRLYSQQWSGKETSPWKQKPTLSFALSRSEDLKMTIMPYKIRLFSGQHELTRDDGMRVIFSQQDGTDIVSSAAVWKVRKLSDTQVGAFLKWPQPINVFQAWYFTLMPDGAIQLEILSKEKDFLFTQNERIECSLKNNTVILEEKELGNKAKGFSLDEGDVQFETLDTDKICEISPRGPYFLTVRDYDKKINSKQKRKTYFRGIFSSNKNKKFLTAPRSLLIHEIQRGDLQVLFKEGACCLSWRHKVLTTGFGLYTSLYSQGMWFDSSRAKWEAKKFTPHSLVVVGRWPWKPLSQTWEIFFENEEKIRFVCSMRVSRDVAIDILETVLMLSKGYASWAWNGDQQKFFDEFTNNDFFRICPWTGPADGRNKVSMLSKELPSVTFQTAPLKGHQIVLESAEHICNVPSRLFHCLRVNRKDTNLFHPGEYEIFNGSISINEEGKV